MVMVIIIMVMVILLVAADIIGNLHYLLLPSGYMQTLVYRA